VHLVELGTLRDPTLVPRAVSAALGVAVRAGDSMTDMLIEALRPQKLLLLLDDCDHVVDACGELAYRLLRGAPEVAILATCREPLGVRGEIGWRVPPLQTPGSGASLAEVASSEAAQLFVERVRAVAPWFKLTEANAAAVAGVCRRLDGIPLALELAAARMKALSVDQLSDRLEQGFVFLTGGSRTAPSRQQTMRATVDFSYDLLTESERALFRRLSVFGCGWTVEAAERVTAGDPLTPGDTLFLLERLIDKSLVVCEERSGTVRESMLDTLREYAHERLVESGEEHCIRRRHLEWVLDEVEAVDPDELGPGVIEARLLEVQNLRAALAWTIESDDAEAGLRLATSASKVWNYQGHFAEGLSWLQRVLGLSRAEEYPRLRGLAYKWIGSMQYGLGDMVAAKCSIARGCQLIAGQPEARQPPLCSYLMGNVARATGNLASALTLYEQALAEYAELGLRFWEEVTLFVTSSALFEQGDHAAARAACDRCLALGEGRKFTWATSRVRVILAYLAEHDGDHIGAERLGQEALTQLRALSELSGVGIALRALSQFALEQGNAGRASSCLSEALEIACLEADSMALARTLETLACLLATNASEEAAQIAGAASVLRTRTGTVPWPTEQARLTRWLGDARRNLGSAAFGAAWTVGEALSEAEAAAAGRRFVAEAIGSSNARPPTESIEFPLTARQREVAGLVARGLTNEQIAQELVISPSTARAHVEHVMDRLDLHSRAQLASWATTHGLVTTVQG
jgi:non-specific serine/threonine protein kinase